MAFLDASVVIIILFESESNSAKIKQPFFRPVDFIGGE